MPEAIAETLSLPSNFRISHDEEQTAAPRLHSQKAIAAGHTATVVGACKEIYLAPCRVWARLDLRS
jgi:hypothetical protein